jgi:hypothetical protein
MTVPRKHTWLALLLLITATTLHAEDSQPEPSGVLPAPPVVTGQASDALRRMSRFLAESKSFAFQADVVYEVVLGDGQKIQYGSRLEAALRRPGELRVDIDGDQYETFFLIDDGQFTFGDIRPGVLAKSKVPRDLDAAMDDAFLRLGMSVPVADLLYSDPYAVLMESAQWGRQVGIHDVRGVPCIHLAFTSEGLDWQIWIEDGPEPLPRKFVVDWKHLVGSPTYSATFTKWKLNPKLKKDFATFEASSGMTATEFLENESPFEETDQ